MLLLMGLAEGAVLARLVHFLLGWCTSCSVGATLARLVHLRQVHPLSVPPFAFAVRSVSVRRPIGFRPLSVEKCWEKRCKNVVLNGNTIGDFAIFDVSVFRCFYYPHPNHLCRSVKSVGESLFAWLVHLRQVHPLKLHLKSVGEYSAVNSEFCVFCGRPFRQTFDEIVLFCPISQAFRKKRHVNSVKLNYSLYLCQYL